MFLNFVRVLNELNSSSPLERPRFGNFFCSLYRPFHSNGPFFGMK